MAASMDKRNQPEKPEPSDRFSTQPQSTDGLANPQANDLERKRRSPATLKELAQRLRKTKIEPPNADRLRSRKHRQRLQAENIEGRGIPAPRPKTVPLRPLRSQPPSPQLPLRTPTQGQRHNPFQPPSSNPQPQVNRSLNLPNANKLQKPNPWAVNPNNNPTTPEVNPQSKATFHNNPGVKSGNPLPERQRRFSTETFTSRQLPPEPRSRRDNILPPISDKAKPTRNRRSKVNATPTPTSPPLRRPQKRPLGLLVYVVRLLVLGVGIGVIAGTLLSALNPTMQASVSQQETSKEQKEPTPPSPSPTLQLTQEIPSLKTQLQTLVRQNPTLNPGVFVVDLESGSYVDLDGGTLYASASTIKLPILVAFFQDVDAGKMRLDELLTMKSEMVADGSGDMQYKKVGTAFTALEVATKMMVISDNTATNMLIERLGGKEALNQRFQSWGLTTTSIRNRLPDIEGTNTTSAKELANLLSVVNRGNLVSLSSRDRLLSIMQRNEINNLLPQGLGTGATIAHKTGNIGLLLADAGIVDLPTGKRYAIAVMVKRPFNDSSAQELIRQISRKTYNYFNTPRATPSTNTTPTRNTRTLTRAIAADNTLN
jgi:beta-lactamase class A